MKFSHQLKFNCVNEWREHYIQASRHGLCAAVGAPAHAPLHALGRCMDASSALHVAAWSTVLHVLPPRVWPYRSLCPPPARMMPAGMRALPMLQRTPACPAAWLPPPLQYGRLKKAIYALQKTDARGLGQADEESLQQPLLVRLRCRWEVPKIALGTAAAPPAPARPRPRPPPHALPRLPPRPRPSSRGARRSRQRRALRRCCRTSCLPP
jgi:hypothetical protein